MESMDWFRDLQVPVQAAVVAGSVAVLTAIIAAIGTWTSVFLKDRLDRRLEASRQQRVQAETYRRYADPLSDAATSLYWRLREVFETRGGYYLALGGGTTRYEEYKAFSTQYRVAVLLGWIAALKRELVLCDAQPDGSVASMKNAIARVERTLAEGGHVEVERARLLSELWQFQLSEEAWDDAGRRTDAALKRYLYEASVSAPAALDASARSKLLESVAGVLSAITGSSVPLDEVLSVADQAMEILSTREAWLYRDWQSAIGDLMLEEPVHAARRFDVKSYRAFTELALDGTAADKSWVQRLGELTANLDVDADERLDARIGQLRGLYLALASLISEFHQAEPEQSSVGKQTLDAVAATLAKEHT
jgi:hypothetical protein